MVFFFSKLMIKNICISEKLVTLETNDKIVNFFSDLGFNDT